MLTLEEELGGTVSAEGPLSIIPIFADLQIAVAGYHILPFRAHVLDKVRIIIEDGKIATKGTVVINAPTRRQINGYLQRYCCSVRFFIHCTKQQKINFSNSKISVSLI